uniref:Uncharacterized protein LOC102802192 n=1 Tax=Saccoglossus kowalevskii TaxID=10224 RepID=A0ABM0MGD0_SACKO|nr:PREDICTED: uncharacterized protein LOC102802192 [Saccoglossus kowalevskii]
MELTAATVAVRLNKRLQEELDYPIENTYFWTDSTSVLRYLSNETTRFHTFVANRMTVIHEGSEKAQWRYIDTKSNPADDASRGMTVNEFLENKRWIYGPEFLWKPEQEWPSNEYSWNIAEDDPEVKRNPVAAVTCQGSADIMDRCLSYASSWEKLKKIVGWVLIGIKNLQSWVSERKSLEESLRQGGTNKGKISVEERMKELKLKARSQSKEKLKHEVLPVDTMELAEREP